jgi:hypothetical protein
VSAERVESDPDPEAPRVGLGDLTVRVYDLGPEPAYHKNRRLFGPWRRYEAQLVGLPAVRATGWSAFDALSRLVANHRSVFDERWPVSELDQREAGRNDGVG